MKSLTGKNLTFQTAPVITTDGHEGGQTVNLIDPAAVKKAVQAALYPAPATPKPTVTATSLAASATTVDVLNGGTTGGLAGETSQALTSAASDGHVGDATPVSATKVLYGAGGRPARPGSPVTSPA